VRRLVVRSGMTAVMLCVVTFAAPAPAASQQAGGTVNPFQNPDVDFDKFPIPNPLPASAGTIGVPKAGPWEANNFPGDMICKGQINLNLPLEPVRDAGTIEVRNGGQTLFGDSLGADEEDITMQSVPKLLGRYAGTVSGSPGGVPMSIDFFWQVVTDEWIVGYLTSQVKTQGMTCNMFRTYELRWTGVADRDDDRDRERDRSQDRDVDQDRDGDREQDRDGDRD